MRRALLLLIVFLFAAITSSASITGVVVRDDGTPIPGATVRAFVPAPADQLAALAAKNEVPSPIETGKTADDGRFAIDAKGAATVRLVIDGGSTATAFAAADGEDVGAIVLSDASRRITIVGENRPLPNVPVLIDDFAIRSDAAGRIPSGTFELPIVVAPDYAVAIGGDPWGDDLVLSHGTALRGKVLLPSGAPAADATISLRGVPVGVTASDGTFVVAHAPEQWHSLAIRSGKLAAIVTNGSNLSNIKLRPTVAISGNVTSPSGAVAGARVAFFSGGGAELGAVFTDARGHYTIDVVPGSYAIRVTHPAYAQASNAGIVTVLRTMTQDVRMSPPLRVAGRVVDEDGKPVAGAIVTSSNVFARSGLSAANGDFLVRPLTTGTSVDLYAFKSGFATAAVRVPVSKPSATITLRRGFPLQVNVTDRERHPVANARVELFTASDDANKIQLPCGMSVRGSCRTAADGTLKLRVVEGKYDVRVSGETIAPTIIAERTLSPRENPLVLAVDAAVEVSGRVTFDDRTPIAGARVMTRSPRESASTLTDANGDFTLRGLSRVSVPLFAVTADETPMQSRLMTVTPPARDVAIVLPRPARVEGRVIDRATMQPVTAFSISAAPRQAAMPPTRIAVANDDGAFVLPRVTPGALDLRVDAPQYVAATVSDITAAEGKTVSGVEVKLDRAATIAGTVMAGGKPVSGARVQRVVRAGNGFLQSTTDDAGAFTLEGVPPGDETIVVVKDGFVPKQKTVTAEAGKTARADVELDRGSEVRGRVTDKQGNAVAAVDVVAEAATSIAPPHTVTADDGSFTLSGLAEGLRYKVAARKKGWVGSSVDDVDPATAPALALTVDRGATLTGHVRGLSDADLPLVEARASAANAWSTARVDTAGNFTLDGVPDGHVTITAVKVTPPVRNSAPLALNVVNGAAPPIEIDFAAGIDVHGRITRDGAPVAGGSIQFMPRSGGGARFASATIGPDGSYDAADLTPGDYLVRIFLPGGVNETRPYTVSGSAEFDIDLQGGSVRGRVLDAATSVPIADAVVTASATPPAQLFRDTTTDSDGRFVLDTIPDGTYVVRAQHEHYSVAQQNLSVTGGSAAPIELALSAGTPARIRVVDADSGALLEAFATFSGGPRNVSTQAVRNDDGSLQAWVDPGHYQVMVYARGYAQGKGETTVPGDELRIALAKAARLALTSATGGQFVMQLAGETRPSHGASVRAGHTVFIESLTPGVWTVRKMDGDMKTVLKEYVVTLASGQTATLAAD